jgi:hypothetical protein
MLKVEDKEKTMVVSVEGTTQTILVELAHLVADLKEKMPGRYIKKAVNVGLKAHLEKADKED